MLYDSFVYYHHRQRGSAALVRPTCKVYGEWRNLTPVTSKSLKLFKFELDIHDYVPEFYTSANFHFNSFRGGFSPDRWNITVLRLFLITRLYFFSRAHAQVELVDGFPRFMTHTTCFRPKTVVLGVATISEFILEQYPPPPKKKKILPKRGVNRQFQAKPAEYKHRDVLQSIDTINEQF